MGRVARVWITLLAIIDLMFIRLFDSPDVSQCPAQRLLGRSALPGWWCRIVSLIAATLTAFCTCAVSGDEANTPPVAEDATAVSGQNLAQDVPIWIADLDGSTSQVRREAEQRLLAAGPEAGEYAPVTLDHLSIDARERMQRIEAKWRQMKTRVESETTTVNMQNARTLGAALDAISQASGVEFDLESAGPGIDRGQPIRPATTPLGFWQAVDLVLDQADLDINFYGGDRQRLSLVPRPADQISRADAAAYAGIYRLQPTVVTARRVLGDASQSSLNLTMSIAWQPNRTPIGLSIPIAQLKGKFDNGDDLQPQASGESIDIATSGEIAESQFYLPLQLPHAQLEFQAGGAGPAKSNVSEITHLSGQITALIPGQRKKFELSLADVAPSQTHDAMTVSIEGIRDTKPLREIRVGVELFGAGRALESHRQWIFENEVFVLMPDGTRKEHLGYEVYRQTESGVGIGYLFDLDGVGPPPAGAKLIYDSPTSVRRNDVPFVLNGIPLP